MKFVETSSTTHGLYSFVDALESTVERKGARKGVNAVRGRPNNVVHLEHFALSLEMYGEAR